MSKTFTADELAASNPVFAEMTEASRLGTPTKRPTFFRAVETEIATGDVLSMFETDSTECSYEEALRSLLDMVAANLTTENVFEVRRFAKRPSPQGHGQ